MKPAPATLVRSNLFTKTNHTINSVARNTSCSRGWLRLVVQAIFGTIIVTSFALIILMAFQKPPHKLDGCRTSMCRVTCAATDYGDEEIAISVMEAVPECEWLQLILTDHKFDNRTIPPNWLEKLPPSVSSLTISGGNLKHISNNAFMSQFASHLNSIVLDHVEISLWSPNTLVGLAELYSIRIRNTNITTIERNALRAVDDTIKEVTITGSGRWNPAHIAGSKNMAKLSVVNFSSNDFNSILGPFSFTGLESCQDLFLNSCKITSIRPGAFDSLKSIRMLYLNDNYLITIPTGLFRNIINMETDVKPRVNLQNNLWHCDCTQNDILELSSKDLLLVDPTCYHPFKFHGTPFSGLEEFCSNKTHYNYYYKESSNLDDVFTIDYNSSSRCKYGTVTQRSSAVHVISPLPNFKCPDDNVRNFDRKSQPNLEGTNVDIVNSSWMSPHFVLRYNNFSMMQIGLTSGGAIGYGLLWYHSECPNEMYCFNIMPDILRLYNVNPSVKYTFCPFKLYSSSVEINQCVNYNLSNEMAPTAYNPYQRPLLYAATGGLSLLLGAILVYAIIRINPYLLKGSKRLLFVKHRTVDALVLPPKVPLRTSLTKTMPTFNYDEEKVYTVSEDGKLVIPGKFMRTDSMRSDKSSSPTYISAMQPSDAQLADWRIRHHFDKNISLTSYTSDAYSLFHDNNLNDNISQIHIAYESLK